MAFTTSALRHGKLVAASVFALGLLNSASYAYTQEQQQLCTGDAMRLCGAEIPDVDRVTACMVRQRSQLSPGCRAFFREPQPELTPVATGKPLVIKPRKASKAKKPHKPR